MFRIDVYPSTVKAEDLQKNDNDGIPISPLEPLYACLATTKSDGELFTVGRKDSDVILNADKSVSRRHLTASLKSTLGSMEDRITAIPPGTAEETESCENDPNDCCIILTDSSKFGTFLVKEGSAPPKSKTPAKNKDDESSDTEDESQKPRNDNDIPLSPVTAMLTNSKATLEKMEPSSSLVIPKLGEGDRVIVQCGQNGSTLVIQRIPLHIIWSRLDKSTKDLWTKRLPALGATALHVPDESLTHLVTNERVSNSKTLLAWYMRKHIVTTEFLQQLWDRKSPTAPMPKESDVAPPTGKEDGFWKNEPNPQLMNGCTMLALIDDEFVPLCRAAGADIVVLHDVSEKQAIARLKSMENFDHHFFVSSTSKKIAKIVKHLTKEGVAHVTQKAVAKSVAQLVPLEDSHHNVVGPPPPEEEEEVIPPPEEEEEEPATVVVPSSQDEADHDAIRASQLPPPMDPIPEEETKETSDKSRKKRSKEEPQEEEEGPKQRRKTSREDEPDKEAKSTSADTTSKRAQQSETTLRKNKRNKETTQEQDKEEERRKLSKDQDDEPAQEEEEKSMEEDEPEWDGQPKKLQVSNGWFVAAPTGKQRKAYVRPVDEDTDNDPPPPTAGTAVSSKLVVGPSKKPNHRAQSMGRSGGKDFKGFRKNRVAKGAGMSRIQLRSVLPKESEAEKALDDRERALEEEQRVADALFHDAGGGIRSHFKPKGRKKRS